ncbi:hypothetical protein M3Y97_01075300 [Aphelenchoides bicaudatus]|nr:hypothetical protein M3Y97_01075300 [Aphelenchoides bicaudatus]
MFGGKVDKAPKKQNIQVTAMDEELPQRHPAGYKLKTFTPSRPRQPLTVDRPANISRPIQFATIGRSYQQGSWSQLSPYSDRVLEVDQPDLYNESGNVNEIKQFQSLSSDTVVHVQPPPYQQHDTNFYSLQSNSLTVTHNNYHQMTQLSTSKRHSLHASDAQLSENQRWKSIIKSEALTFRKIISTDSKTLSTFLMLTRSNQLSILTRQSRINRKNPSSLLQTSRSRNQSSTCRAKESRNTKSQNVSAQNPQFAVSSC